MEISLLNENVFVFLSIISASIVTFIITHLKKKWFSRKGIILIFISLILSLSFEALTQMQFSTDKLPTLLWLMTIPFTLSLVLTIATWKNKIKWLKWLAIFNIFFSFIYSGVLINGYYDFFPTVGSVFGIQANIKQISFVQDNKFNQKNLNTRSIEGSLFSTTQKTEVGQVYSIKIPGLVSHFNARTSYVYVPPIDLGKVQIPLPVIVLTAGFPGIPSNWLGSGIANTLNNFAKQHHGITPLVFMVDNTGALSNDTECVNSPRGNLETYLTVDVPNYIKSHYNVASSPSHWAIGGLSMGGMCSMMLTLRHPNVYSNFIDLGGEAGPILGGRQATIDLLFHGSVKAWARHQPSLLLLHKKFPTVGGFFGVGKNDNSVLISNLKGLYQESKKSRINSIFYEIPGSHTFLVWHKLFQASLPWVSHRIGATECLNNKLCKL